MRAFIFMAMTVVLAGCGNSAPPDRAPTPKVLVGLQPVTRGSATDWLTAYGSAAPSIAGSQTISVPQPGQVSRLGVTPGAAVHAGQMLVVFATAPSAVSVYQQAVTTLATAQKQQGTTAQLLTQQLATRDQLAQADKVVADAQAALKALKSEGAGQAVRTLTAPFAGVVTNIAVAQGDRTQAGVPLVTIARTGDIIATVGVDASDRARVHDGQRARIARLNGGVTVPGRVIRVDAVLNLKTRLIDVDLAFPANALLPNEALRGEIAVGQVGGWLVPHRAVVTAGGPTRIYQEGGGKAHTVPVRLLLAGDTVDVVDGKVDPKRRLIVAGAYQVTDGDAVRWVSRR